MGRVVFDASEVLNRHKLSHYDLAREVEGLGISRATAYAVASGRSNPSFDSLSKLIQALRNLTGETVQVSDVLRWMDDLPAQAQNTG